MAADLTQKGYEVAMCEAPEFRDGISKTLERQAIDLIDAWGGEAHGQAQFGDNEFRRGCQGCELHYDGGACLWD